MNAPQTSQDQPESLFKAAGVHAALADLGLGAGDTEKTALVGRVLVGAGRMLFRGLGHANKAVASPFGRAGNRAVQSVGSRLGASPQTIKKIQGLGSGMAREAVGFGALSGGMEAAMADPGERMGTFARGFGTGALGGLAWRGGSNLVGAGLRKAVGAGAGGAARLGKMETLQGQKWFGDKMSLGQRAKGWGAKALMGGVPLAAGLGASMYTPTFHKDPSQGGHFGQRGYQAMPQQGLLPSYNPNLPLPQY